MARNPNKIKKHYHLVFERMSEGFAYCQMLFSDGQPQDFVYLDVNTAFGELTGLKDVVGKRITELLPAIHETNPEIFTIYGRVSLTGTPEKFEVFLPSLNIWLAISVYCPEKGYFVAVFSNITERKCLQQKLQLQATTDELTGIFNRRYFIEAAFGELKRAARNQHPLALALIDLDNLKQINDTYGHAMGDQALLVFTRTCQKNIREIDIFARFGGDEFVLLLLEADCQQACAVVERVRSALGSLPLNHQDPPVPITISAGISGLVREEESLDALLVRADLALYQAKQNGRNSVRTA